MKIKKYIHVMIVLLFIILFLTGCVTVEKKTQKVTSTETITEKKKVDDEAGKKVEEATKKEAKVPNKVYLIKNETVYFPDGSIDSIREYKYDKTGNLIEVMQKNSNNMLISGLQYKYRNNILYRKSIINEKGDVLTYYIYNYENNYLYSITQYDFKDNIQTVSKYDYNKMGKKVLWEVFDGKGTKMAFTKYYYDGNKVVKEEIYDPDGGLEGYIDIAYSGDKKIKESYYGGKDNLEKYIEYKYKDNTLENELYYKAKGDIIRTIYYKYDSNKNIKEIIVYDSKGNIVEKREKNYID